MPGRAHAIANGLAGTPPAGQASCLDRCRHAVAGTASRAAT